MQPLIAKAAELWERGTQTVFGEGARRAEVLFVGEQPGNEEDLSGKPFVGPAGCSTMHFRKPASIVRKPTSQMSLSISNGNRAASDAFIKSPTPEKLPLADPGLGLRSI